MAPEPHSKEFRDDVVGVARQGRAPIAETAKDFESLTLACATGSMPPTSRAAADGPTRAESAELPEKAYVGALG